MILGICLQTCARCGSVFCMFLQLIGESVSSITRFRAIRYTASYTAALAKSFTRLDTWLCHFVNRNLVDCSVKCTYSSAIKMQLSFPISDAVDCSLQILGSCDGLTGVNQADRVHCI
jgi:hypothetical protein